MVTPVYSGLDENGHPEFLGEEIVLTESEMAEMYQVRAPFQVNFSTLLRYNVDISPLVRACLRFAATFDRMLGCRAQELAEAYRRLARSLTQEAKCSLPAEQPTVNTTTSPTASSTPLPVSKPSPECSETPMSHPRTDL